MRVEGHFPPHVDILLFQHHCLKEFPFPFRLLWCLSSKNQMSIYVWVCFWVLYSVELINMSILTAILYFIDYIFTVSFKVR